MALISLLGNWLKTDRSVLWGLGNNIYWAMATLVWQFSTKHQAHSKFLHEIFWFLSFYLSREQAAFFSSHMTHVNTLRFVSWEYLWWTCTLAVENKTNIHKGCYNENSSELCNNALLCNWYRGSTSATRNLWTSCHQRAKAQCVYSKWFADKTESWQ